MTTAVLNQLAETARTIREAGKNAIRQQSPDDFSIVESRVNQLAAEVREVEQEIWADAAANAIGNLESGDPLTRADIDAIRTFLIGDAERYVALENNFNDWAQEFDRLLDEISQKSANPDARNVADLRGYFQDLSRLVPDIRNFLEEKRRIQQFENALGNLDATSRRMMADILREKIASDRC